jgi:transcriptional regulator with XRE-family HTH domain
MDIVELKKTVGGRLQELRNSKKLSQYQLAENVSINQSSIAEYERGNQLPPVNNLIIFANIFHVSLDYLTGRTNDPALHQMAEFNKANFQGCSERELKFLSIMFSAVNQFLDDDEPKAVIETLTAMADRAELSDEFKNLAVILSKMVVERYKKELLAMEEKINELGKK